MTSWVILIGIVVILGAVGMCFYRAWCELLLPDWDPNGDGFPPEEDLL